ncbi:MAG: DUF1800 domain-containing protein [bacterium]
MSTAASSQAPESCVTPASITAEPVDESPGRGREPTTRRTLLAFGAAATAAVLLPGAASAQSTRRRPAPPKKGDFNSIIPNEVPVAPVEWASDTTRLLRRITMGTTDVEVALAKRYGFRGYLERQLQFQYVDDSVADTFVATKYPLLAMPADQLFAQNSGTIQNQLSQMTLYRAAFSSRQLYERMVEFWSDHFNISFNKVGYLKAVDDRDVIRKHALGNFRDLLFASAKSAAMMLYLDQNQSRAGAPNENYAREIMELHTLGVDGGYSQNDVAELSRVLTGWTIAGRGNFSFNPAIHDWKAKTVLGVTIPAGAVAMGAAGIQEGEQMINVLLDHPSTGKFIALKMLRWFLSYDPTQAQIDAVAAEYTRTQGDIKAMIRATLNSAWLRTAPMKLKRPFHYVASALRSAHPTVTGVAGMNGQLNNVGQPLFVWETPDGYPDKVEYWAGNILPRWTFGNTLAAQSAGEIIIDIALFQKGNTADATIATIDARVFGGEMDAALRASLTAYLKAGTYNAARIRETLALAFSANSFQWY